LIYCKCPRNRHPGFFFSGDFSGVDPPGSLRFLH
jgi:hypothetical protein